MMAHWLDIGWGRFAEYVQGTWIDQLPGWWSGYLGTGTPSTTGGVEGIWPVVHRMVHGIVTPQKMARVLMSYVVPYFARKNDALHDHSRPLR